MREGWRAQRLAFMPMSGPPEWCIARACHVVQMGRLATMVTARRGIDQVATPFASGIAQPLCRLTVPAPLFSLRCSRRRLYNPSQSPAALFDPLWEFVVSVSQFHLRCHRQSGNQYTHVCWVYVGSVYHELITPSEAPGRVYHLQLIAERTTAFEDCFSAIMPRNHVV